MYKKYSVEEKKKVVSLFFDGTPVSQLTSDTDIPKSTIYRWIRESKAEEGNSSIYSPLNYYMLEKEYKKLQNIIEILQKVNCKLTDPLSIKLPEMESLYGQYSVHTLCEALCVSRGTFYNHVLRRKSSGKWYEIRREEFRERIRQIYDESNQVLGPKKICAVLQDQGHPTSVRLVRELMKDMGLTSVRQGAKGEYEKEQCGFKNLVQRQFDPQQPNEVWVSDITYYRFNNKNYYICVILDLFSRRVIAYRISTKNSTQLTKKRSRLPMRPENQRRS